MWTNPFGRYCEQNFLPNTGDQTFGEMSPLLTGLSEISNANKPLFFLPSLNCIVTCEYGLHDTSTYEISDGCRQLHLSVELSVLSVCQFLCLNKSFVWFYLHKITFCLLDHRHDLTLILGVVLGVLLAITAAILMRCYWRYRASKRRNLLRCRPTSGISSAQDSDGRLPRCLDLSTPATGVASPCPTHMNSVCQPGITEPPPYCDLGLIGTDTVPMAVSAGPLPNPPSYESLFGGDCKDTVIILPGSWGNSVQVPVMKLWRNNLTVRRGYAW